MVPYTNFIIKTKTDSYKREPSNIRYYITILILKNSLMIKSKIEAMY